MKDPLNRPPLAEQDYIDGANELGCKVAAIKAVAEVESSGSGYLPTGELVILFEPHIFWKWLKSLGQDPAAVLQAYPEAADILYQKYKGHDGERPSQQWDRVRRAANLPYDPAMRAAYEATSFGRFQIMGFNHKAAGYGSVFEMVHDFDEGESYHLKAFVRLIKDFGLAGALQREDWTAFAKGYNGPAFKTNKYDEKLATAFEKYSV